MTAEQLAGLARGVLVGEALSWPNAGYRIRLMPPRRLARMETLAEFARAHATTTPAVPYAHSSPAATLQPGAGEASEWFAFSAAAFGRARAAGSLAPIGDAWRRIAGDPASADAAARIGTRIALGNLRAGLPGGASGNDNPHYFDDMPMVRAVAAAGAFPDEGARREAAVEDASFTGARDGVWCAEATALLFSRLLDGAPAADAARAAADILPADTWSRRMAEEAFEAAAAGGSPLELAHRLSTRVGDTIYSYPTVAPETFAFLVAELASADSADGLMLAALAQPRNAPTLPALAGAAAAIAFGEGWMPAGLDLTAPLTGVSVPELAGRPIGDALREA